MTKLNPAFRLLSLIIGLGVFCSGAAAFDFSTIENKISDFNQVYNLNKLKVDLRIRYLTR